MSRTDDVKLSKTLSYLLRHGAKKEGLYIDPEGYVVVSDILNYKSLSGVTLTDIITVVENNDKKRFKLTEKDGKLVIKAQQGHSLCDVETEHLHHITKASEEPVVVHGTYMKNWNSIKKEGLKRMKRNHIHFASGLPKDRDVVSGIRNTCEVYIYIDLPRALTDGIKFHKSENGVILTPGDDNGVLDKKYFKNVITANGGGIQLFD